MSHRLTHPLACLLSAWLFLATFDAVAGNEQAPWAVKSANGATTIVQVKNTSFYLNTQTSAGVVKNSTLGIITGGHYVDLSSDVNGQLPIGNLITSTNRDASHYLRGDGTWVSPPGGVPSGAAGGDLTGSYPNPTLATVNSGPGTTGDSTHVAQITTNGKGLVTAQSSVAIAYPGSFSGFANPTATLTSSFQSGSATTAMRSDAAPKLPQALDTAASPTFVNPTGQEFLLDKTSDPFIRFNQNGTTRGFFTLPSAGGNGLSDASANDLVFRAEANTQSVRFGVNSGGASSFVIGNSLIDIVSANARIKAGVLQIGNASALAYNRIGASGTTAHSLASSNQLYVQGDTELAAKLYVANEAFFASEVHGSKESRIASLSGNIVLTGVSSAALKIGDMAKTLALGGAGSIANITVTIDNVVVVSSTDIAVNVTKNGSTLVSKVLGLGGSPVSDVVVIGGPYTRGTYTFASTDLIGVTVSNSTVSADTVANARVVVEYYLD